MARRRDRPLLARGSASLGLAPRRTPHRSAWWRWPSRVAVALGTAALLAACHRQPAIDLVDHWAGAERLAERHRIDLGAAAARPQLLHGWGNDEHDEGTTFVWGTDDESVLELFVAAPRPITLRMRCWPLPYGGLPPQSVQLALNGVALATIGLESGRYEYAVALPPAALRAGRNALHLRYAYSRRPADLDPASPDTRNLAVAWDWIELDGVDDAEPPSPLDGGGLRLPPRSEVGFYVDVPPDSVLEIADPPPDVTGATVTVTVEPEDAPMQTFDVAAASAASRRWPLPSGRLRIAFRNGSAPAAPGQGTVVLGRPRVQLGSAPAAEPPCAAATALRGQSLPPLVLVYLVDTLRADHLGCYGYGRPTSPRIDAFALQAVRFERALAQAPWTKPAVASIFTGLTPPQHGATGVMSGLARMPTMASLLGGRGYATAAFVTNGFIGYDFGLAQGFTEHRVLPEEPIGPEEGVTPGGQDVMHQRIEVLQRIILDWLDRRGAAVPLFLYVHASDPHAPYLPPPPFRERFAAGIDPQRGLVSSIEQLGARHAPLSERECADLEALYDGEVAYADEQFGAFLDAIRERGLYDDAFIAFVADHGEAFGEHGRLQHGSSLFETQIAIPLLIKLPGNRAGGTVVPGVAQQIDLLPTLLDLLGIAPPQPLPGRSLLAASACTRPLPARRAVYSHLGGEGLAGALDAVVIGADKLVLGESGHNRALYELGRDPGEQRDIALDAPFRAAYMAALAAELKAATGAATPAAQPPVDPAVRERLRALGYAH